VLNKELNNGRMAMCAVLSSWQRTFSLAMMASNRLALALFASEAYRVVKVCSGRHTRLEEESGSSSLLRERVCQAP
jgi:uncharacterized protein YciW